MTDESLPNSPAVNRPVGWGILGTGNIAWKFARDFAFVSDARLVAVGSRRQERARVFGQQFGISYRHGSYRELAQNPHVQAVYIATPASAHKANIELCLRAGKAVLCEKPLTVNAREAEEVIALARRNRVFLMEAMWTRFVPLIARLQGLLAQRVVGEIRHFMADLGSQVTFDPDSRIYSAELGGGALLQKGVYLLSLASLILGSPTSVRSLSVCAKTAVDEGTGILLAYPGGCMATLWCSVGVRGQRQGVIVGTKGQIVIHDPIICPSNLSLRLYGAQERHHAPVTADSETSLKARLLRYAKSSLLIRNLRERFPALSDRLLYGIRCSTICLPPIGEGLHYQVSEVNRCLRAGRLESNNMSLNESLSIMATIDLVREQSEKTHTEIF
jgi:dihydrodiol dehydrogenase / D-xylose 1-dehydrogenase (NADP)